MDLNNPNRARIFQVPGWVWFLSLFLSGMAWGQLRFDRITIEDGLSQGSIQCILQDRDGFMWFGTEDGLNKYDGYHITIYRKKNESSNSLSGNRIYALFQDREGILWIGTAGAGLNRFDPEKEQFSHFYHDTQDSESLSHNDITTIYEDRDQRLWIGTYGGGMNLFERETGRFRHFRHDPDNTNTLSDDQVTEIFQDRDGQLWIATASGLNRFDPETSRFTRFLNDPDDPKSLSHNEPTSIHQDQLGRLWIGAFGGGLNRFLPESENFIHFRHEADRDQSLSSDRVKATLTDRSGDLWVGTRNGGLNRYRPERGFEHFLHDPSDLFSLTDSDILSLYEDRAGVLWIGTVNGLNKFDRNGERFLHFRKHPNRPGSLSHNRVKTIYEDRTGALWIGTFGGGLNRFNPEQKRFVHFRHDPEDLHSLSNDRVSSLCETRSGVFWVGTDHGLNRLDRQAETFSAYHFEEDNPTCLSHNRVRAIYEDRAGTLWICTLGGGLNRYEPETDTFRHFQHNPEDKTSLSNDRAYVLKEDRRDNFWVGTFGGGLNLFDREAERFTPYRSDPNNPNSLSHDDIWCIHEDSEGFLWLGTNGGLNRLDPQTDIFVSFHEKDGLPNEVIYGILGDEDGNLWLSTNRGLSRFDPKAETFKNYDIHDGLQANEFNSGAFFRGRDGRMYFGGPRGFNTFFPKKVARDDPNIPQVVITDFLLFNQSVPLQRDDPGSPLSKRIHTLKSLTLSYRDDIFAFEFAALHFAKPMRNSYAYKLQGVDKDWIPTDASRRFATYTKLEAGNYLFKVKGSNRDGVWNEEGTAIQVFIEPPPWKTWWAYTLYGLIIIALVGAFLWSGRKKLEAERAMNRRLKQVDTLKDEFLAKTSHELRTPLNGIIGLAESLMDGAGGPLPGKAKENLAMLVSSGKRLSTLVDDILDFSKLKNKTLDLLKRPVDLHALTDVVLTLCKPLAGNKSLVMKNDIDVEIPTVHGDENRIKQIMYNLVGNAIKFTESGSILVSATVADREVVVSVSDTGIGIPEDKQDNIFESFEQAEDSLARVYGGTGLGLAITRQLIHLHGGRIRVTSTPGKGSIFSFTLPTSGRTAVPAEELDTFPPLELPPFREESETLEAGVQPIPGDFSILIVDDEPVNRQVLVNLLSLQHYHISEVSSGREALDLLQERLFDLILLDVMMPRMSGYEVCQKIRERYPVQELPIIFLTAKGRVNDLVTGFSLGANDYLTKPISKNELLSRVRTHLELLDINRHLEQKVIERTKELQQKNEEILRRQQQMVIQEKMASMGTLTAGIAHEIRNPLNFVKNFAEISSEMVTDIREILEPLKDKMGTTNAEEVEELLQDLNKNSGLIQNHGMRANRIVENMMDMARGGKGERRLTNINYLVEEFSNMAYHGVKAKHMTLNVLLEKEFDPLLGEQECVPQDLSRVVINLVNNALDAVLEKDRNAGTSFKPMVRVRTRNLEKNMEISVWDNGMGIEKEHLNQIFNPFFTTRPANQGNTGLGLSICYDIVTQEHNGELRVETEAGKYTRFLVLLPK